MYYLSTHTVTLKKQKKQYTMIRTTIKWEATIKEMIFSNDFGTGLRILSQNKIHTHTHTHKDASGVNNYNFVKEILSLEHLRL